MTDFEQNARELFHAELLTNKDVRLGDKLNPKLGLALRRLVVNWLVEAKPRLVHSGSPEGILCYSGLQLVREGNRVQITCPTGPVKQSSIGLHDCAVRMTTEATNMLRSEYRARLTTWFAQEYAALVEANPSHLLSPAWDILRDSYVSWIIEGSMEPKWWGNKASVALLTKLILKHAWEHKIFDKEIWGLCIRVFGAKPMLWQYNQVAENLEAVRARMVETPNLAPLLYSKAIPSCSEPQELRVDVNAISQERDRLFSEGCTPAGWRWLTKQPRQWVLQLHCTCNTEEEVAFINLMAEHQVGRLPTRFVRLSAIQSWIIPDCYELGAWQRHQQDKLTREQKRESVGLFMRLAVQAVRARQVKASEVRDRVIEILDFVKDGHPIKKGATWQSLLRRQAEWHRDMHRARIEEMKSIREKLTAYEWTPIVSEVQYKEVTAISLNTSDALWEEGDMLEHCVGTYADKCFSNHSRIFSMRSADGLPLATLEVTCNRGKWQIAQLRGTRNRAIQNPDLKTLAQHVLRELKRAPQPNPADNKVLRESTVSSWYGLRQRGARPVPVPAPALQVAEADDIIPF